MSAPWIRRGGAALSALLAIGAADVRRTSPAPARLAIYYGYPSLVNGANGDLAKAAAVFADYDAVVLGDGLEFDASRPGRQALPAEHAFAVRLIDALSRAPRHPAVYGYVDLGNSQRLPLDELVARIGLWADMGATGVFFDEAGYDFGVTRARQNAAVDAAHARGLRAFLNAFQPDDVFGTTRVPLDGAGGGNPSGMAPHMTDRDAYLLESFAIRNGIPEAPKALLSRTRRALEGRDRFGTAVFAVSTTGEPGDDASLAAYGWWAAAVLGLDGYGWGMPAFSAVTSRLPWIPRPGAEATLTRAGVLGDTAIERERWRRDTTAGTIVVDPAQRIGSLFSK